MRVGGDVHGVDIAHKDVAEQKVELVCCSAERWTKCPDTDGVLVVLVDDPHWGTQFHGIDGVGGVPISQQSELRHSERTNKRRTQT